MQPRIDMSTQELRKNSKRNIHSTEWRKSNSQTSDQSAAPELPRDQPHRSSATIPKAGSFRCPTPLYSTATFKQYLPSLITPPPPTSATPKQIWGFCGSSTDFMARARRAGSTDEPAPDLELARGIPDARPSGSRKVPQSEGRGRDVP
jgi:hypothetical protein